MLFWNARGLEGSLQAVTELLVTRKVGIAAFMETHSYGENFATQVPGNWYWLAGPELLPNLGGSVPRRGLGALINGDQFPGGSVLRKFKYSYWLRIPGGQSKIALIVCVAHVPVYESTEYSKRDRKLAFDELAQGLELYRGMGVLALVGDFNSRTAMNGDTEFKTCGRQLLDFANDNGLVVVNSLDEICSGKFTRVMQCVRDGAVCLDQTTIDYALTNLCNEDSAVSLTILEDSMLDSDHRPMLYSMRWNVGINKYDSTSNRSALKLKYKLQARSKYILPTRLKTV